MKNLTRTRNNPPLAGRWAGHYRHIYSWKCNVVGVFWGLCSVMITSIAQLSLGFAIDNLPPMLQPLVFISTTFSVSIGAFALYTGLTGYLLSTICWHEALHRLALSKVYVLLSLSCVLVQVVSVILPGWQGTFSVKALAGVPCIMAGLMTIFLPSRKHRP